MQRIDVASASLTLPAPAAPGTPGYFTDGDPVSSVPATIVDNDFLNMIQEELMTVVIAGGQVPSKANYAQLLTAIQAIIGSAKLAANGHIKLTLGQASVIVNWGGGAQGDASGNQTVTFDLPFANACLVAVATNVCGQPPSAFHGVGSLTKTTMRVSSATSSGVAAGAGTGFFYVAIGY